VAHKRANLVKETSTTTGTGTYALLGAVTDFLAFSVACANNDTAPYVARMGSQWEEGIGTWTTGNNLARTLITGSSNAGAAVNWGAGTKVITLGEGVGNERDKLIVLAADHTLASATGTKVTGLDAVNLLPGTYLFRYTLLLQSSATGTGIGTGVNFSTGTATMNARRIAVTTGTTTALGVIDDVSNNLTGALVEGWAATAFSTTTPNMLNGGMATANANCIVTIEGILIVTVTGNLELWHNSETAANTSVKAGSVLQLSKAA
jgi:hypothetical protein